MATVSVHATGLDEQILTRSAVPGQLTTAIRLEVDWRNGGVVRSQTLTRQVTYDSHGKVQTDEPLVVR